MAPALKAGERREPFRGFESLPCVTVCRTDAKPESEIVIMIEANDKPFFTVNEFADILCVDPWTVRYWIAQARRGQKSVFTITDFFKAGRKNLIRRSALERITEGDPASVKAQRKQAERQQRKENKSCRDNVWKRINNS